MGRTIAVPLLICLLAIPVLSRAVTWQTIAPGYWQNPATWAGGLVPPYSSSDTFIISQAVIFEQSISFGAGASVLIDAAGGLCGHKNISVNAGADILKYGILELDTMRVPGGQVLCKAPGDVIFTSYGVITNNGRLEISGCSLAVGPWFTCRLPEFYFQAPAIVLSAPTGNGIAVFPNPNKGAFELSGRLRGAEARFELTDMTGRMVYSILVQQHPQSRQIRTLLPKGLYYWRLSDTNGILEKGKLVVAD